MKRVVATLSKLFIHSERGRGNGVIRSSRSIYGLQCFLVGFAFLRLSLILGTVWLMFHPPIPPDHVLY